MRRRLGTEFLDYAIDPFVAGIYAGDPEQISVRAAFPKLHALEQRWGSLIRGQILGARERKRQKEAAKNTARSFSFAGGMQQLTDALAAALGALALKARVTRLQRDGAGLFTVQAEQDGVAVAWRARTVLLATPADTAAALLREHAADAAAALESIVYAPVATVASAYALRDIAHALDGFGCLVPRKEQRRVLGVLFSSSMFDGRAPAGTALLTTFVGGQRNPELPQLPEGEIADLAHQEHAALLGARGRPSFQAVTRWPRAIPQYTLGHLGRVARAEGAQRVLPGLFFCANWKGGVSVGDCIRNGHLEAEAVAAWLRNSGGATQLRRHDRRSMIPEIGHFGIDPRPAAGVAARRAAAGRRLRATMRRGWRWRGPWPAGRPCSWRCRGPAWWRRSCTTTSRCATWPRTPTRCCRRCTASARPGARTRARCCCGC